MVRVRVSRFTFELTVERGTEIASASAQPTNRKSMPSRLYYRGLPATCLPALIRHHTRGGLILPYHNAVGDSRPTAHADPGLHAAPRRTG